MDICRLQKVTKEYDAGEKVCPIKEVSLDIKAGEFVTIEGPSGTGKSTLLYVMGGLLRPTTGSVSIQGKDISNLTDAQLTTIRANQVGFIFQEANVFPTLTVLENVLFSTYLQTRKSSSKAQRERAIELLGKLGLGERLRFLPHQLSVGQRRRVAVARALVNDVSLVIADEPTNDLDIHWAEEVMKLLKDQVKNGKAVVMVTHHPQWAEAANRRFHLIDGDVREIACL
ncbi:ABC transporter ATP-binding protein [Desulfuribacillus stibiiarsenatis]|uniref:ABC transporter ATP-binding protein n=1 Tax=Desulfuribacillus stibiiarsenatis TaxID=1390249 RepID=A0A1E5L4K5_9FIRM|nr:ABC transporter ATP-binding protein [Desulfuribacillus stibiiarsenatis]OEH85045.1 ABC transporter ATP-binding protein [Desulfuribacillus stibiiarsenatis]